VKSRPALALLVLILAGSFALELNHLDHPAIKPLDEVFHAIVARNFLKHPLTPTIVDQPFLPAKAGDWLTSHIWLHKPPMALWQIALSYCMLGVTPLALRLPSAILSTLAVLFTYLIGVRLLDRSAALVAAALQAFNPVILMLVHGYVFSDHVDISLLFWTELSLLFLIRTFQSGTKKDPIFCGITQGLAFLSKSYPALIALGLAILFWMVRFVFRGRARKNISPSAPIPGPSTPPFAPPLHPLTGRALSQILIATLLTVLPWTLSSAIRFPHEFAAENLRILHHLNENVENWAAPWDQLVFYYWISIFHVFYVAVIVAAAVTLTDAMQTKALNLLFLLAWGAGVMTPHLLATSKTMTATLVGWPAAWLMLGYLVSSALKGDRLALGAWLASMVCAAFLLDKTSIPRGGERWGEITPGFGAIMREHLWVIWQVAISLAAGGLLYILPPHKSAPKIRSRSAIHVGSAPRTISPEENAHPASQTRPKPTVRENLIPFLPALAAALMLLLALRFWKGNHPLGYACVAWEVTQTNAREPNFSKLADFAARLSPNAAFLVEEQTRLENKLIEFATDRSCYAATPQTWRPLAESLHDAGAIPYLITAESEPLPVAFADVDQGLTVYALESPIKPDDSALQSGN
jgi:hypothetical protein